MTRAANPSNLKLKRKSRDTLAENEIGSDSESISEYENINETSSESVSEEASKTTITKKRGQRRKNWKLKLMSLLVNESIISKENKRKFFLLNV